MRGCGQGVCRAAESAWSLLMTVAAHPGGWRRSRLLRARVMRGDGALWVSLQEGQPRSNAKLVQPPAPLVTACHVHPPRRLHEARVQRRLGVHVDGGSRRAAALGSAATAHRRHRLLLLLLLLLLLSPEVLLLLLPLALLHRPHPLTLGSARAAADEALRCPPLARPAWMPLHRGLSPATLPVPQPELARRPAQGPAARPAAGPSPSPAQRCASTGCPSRTARWWGSKHGRLREAAEIPSQAHPSACGIHTATSHVSPVPADPPSLLCIESPRAAAPCGAVSLAPPPPVPARHGAASPSFRAQLCCPASRPLHPPALLPAASRL